MAKRPHMGGRRNVSVSERREQAAAAQKARLEQHQRMLAKRVETVAAEPAEVRAIPKRSTTELLNALIQIPALQIGSAATLVATAPYRQLVKAAADCINLATHESILSWPNCIASPAAVTALIALTDCAVAAPIKSDGYDALAAPVGIRALIYPYARTAHRPLRHIYVDKNYVSRIQLKHQIRAMQPGENPALADYHKSLARVQTLTGKALDGKDYPEFANPCLDELLPSGPCKGAEAGSELLWRVRAKTDIKAISRTGDADNPTRAKFYLFGLRANDDMRSSLKALANPIDIIFLQLDSTGRNRLGHNWFTRVKEFISLAETRFKNVPLVGLTDDPWVYDKLRFDALAPKQSKKSHAIPSRSSVVFAQQSDIVGPETVVITDYTAVERCEVIAFAGKSAELLRRLRSARRAALQMKDDSASELLGQLASAIGRCATLPGSRAKFSEFLEKEVSGFRAAEIMTAYSVMSLLKELRQSNTTWPQLSRREVDEICSAAEAVWANTNELTPMASLLAAVVKRFRNSSSRTLVLFQKDMLADFAAFELSADSDIGERIKSRLANGMLRFLDRAGLDDLEKLPRTEKNYVKTLIVVAPSRSAILSLLAKPWLPDVVIVLGDADTLESAARDTYRLSRYDELGALKSRLAAFTKAATDQVQRVKGTSVVLDSIVEPSDDIESSTSGVVNLMGNIRPDQNFFKFELDGGQIVLARPGTKLVVQETAGVLPLFGEVEARSVEVGDRICAIGDAFVETARPLLNITLRAAEEIRDYHELVVKRFAALPGENTSERLTALVHSMGIPSVAVARARYWVDLDEQLTAPIDDVVPHAPIDIETFLAFMRALSVSDAIARRFWTWAVIAQRSSRVRAGQSIRDAYRAILVDNFAAQSDNPRRVNDVKQLRAAAENFVGAVRSKQELRGDNAGT